MYTWRNLVIYNAVFKLKLENKRDKKLNKRAFTLIEMMIVISIITILIMTANPIFDKIIFKSRADEARATIQSINLAQQRYYHERGNYYPDSAGTVKNEQIISEAIKVDLSKSSNFNYFITKESDGNYTIKAVLRDDSWNTDCDSSESKICKMDGTLSKDEWVDSYSRGEDKHYLHFKYPDKISDDYSENGVSYEYLYDD